MAARSGGGLRRAPRRGATELREQSDVHRCGDPIHSVDLNRQTWMERRSPGRSERTPAQAGITEFTGVALQGRIQALARSNPVSPRVDACRGRAGIGCARLCTAAQRASRCGTDSFDVALRPLGLKLPVSTPDAVHCAHRINFTSGHRYPCGLQPLRPRGNFCGIRSRIPFPGPYSICGLTVAPLDIDRTWRVSLVGIRCTSVRSAAPNHRSLRASGCAARRAVPDRASARSADG